MRTAIGQFNGPYSTVRLAKSKTLFLRALFYGPRASRLGHKSMGKNGGRNLQYGPRTWLVRGI